MKYRFYDLDTELHFGKFMGMSLKQILKIQPSYVVWCLSNLDHFVIDEDTISDIEMRFPGFSLSDSDRTVLEEKWEDAYLRSRPNHQLEPSHEAPSCARGSYGEFEGSYAQDVMDYSDDYIREAFDGEPDAYWNID